MAKVPELLPCPFCGGTDLEVDHYKYSGVAVVCRTRGCGMKIIRYWSDSEVTVREAWNTRANAGDAAQST